MTTTRSRFNKEQKKVVLQKDTSREKILMLFINRSLRCCRGLGGQNDEVITARS